MKYVSIGAAVFLLSISFFSWGYLAAEYQAFPGPVIQPIQEDIESFAAGNGHSERSVKDKLIHDAGIQPKRMLEKQERDPDREYESLPINGLSDDRSSPLLYVKDKEAFAQGYILIWGAFDLKENMYAAILLDSDGDIVHTWMPNQDAFRHKIDEHNADKGEEEEKLEYNDPDNLPQGIALFSDGSLILNDSDPGNGMQKLDFCSQPSWVKLGRYSHRITKTDNDSSIWAIDGDNAGVLRKIDAENGKTLRTITLAEIIKENPHVDILSLRYDDMDKTWLKDRWHINDVHPLPAEYADAFPDFDAGDLLLSLRSQNTLMVVDQDSLHIKWWKMGPFSRQHDPDWQPEGKISVYDNQTRFQDLHSRKDPKFSRILSFDFRDKKLQTLYNGKKDNFYSSIRGNHQLLPNGSMLITSPKQGRVLLVNQDGETVFEFFNRYDDEQALLVSEAIWVPEDFFDFELKDKECSSS
ncbi:MAG: arylsulfotransferase family protein [Desulfovermiculus sp.]